MTKKSTPPPKKLQHQPINPLRVTADGASLLFQSATSVGVFFAILCILLTGVNTYMNQTTDGGEATAPTMTLPQLAFALVVVLVVSLSISVAGAMIKGIQGYTILKLAQNKHVGLREAFNATLDRFGWFFVLYIWLYLRVAFWAIPGLIVLVGAFLVFIGGALSRLDASAFTLSVGMAIGGGALLILAVRAYYRFSFAPLLFFDKGLQHEHALRESSRLASGGLMTIFGSQAIFNLISLYQLQPLVETASLPRLYALYAQDDKKSVAKPPTHWLSWLGLGLTILGFAIYIFIIAAAIVATIATMK